MIELKLGWANPDCGPCSLRLYALDQGDQPRWRDPHARVAEVPLIEAGAREGGRFVLLSVAEYADRTDAEQIADLQGQVIAAAGDVQRLSAALARIAEAHSKAVDSAGGTWGDCVECGWAWPCPTHVWATTDRDPLAPWNPADDGEQP